MKNLKNLHQCNGKVDNKSIQFTDLEDVIVLR